MYNNLSIILVIIAITINSIVFGYVASNTKKNKTNIAYLLFLTFIILYTIFDCIIIQAFNKIETKDIIIKVQALLWMPLSVLFLNFTYSFLGKEKDDFFYLFTTTGVGIFFIILLDIENRCNNLIKNIIGLKE